MLLRRSTLTRLGGFAFLGRFLAEDQVCGEEIARLGLGVTVSGRPIDNVLGNLSVRSFLARHLRWATIRRRMNPAAYAGEVLLNPVFVAVCAALAARTPDSLVLAFAVLLLKSVLDAAGERSAGVRRSFLVYPFLTLMKDLLVGCVWVVPFLSTSVTWRGNRFHIGARTAPEPDALAHHGDSRSRLGRGKRIAAPPGARPVKTSPHGTARAGRRVADRPRRLALAAALL